MPLWRTPLLLLAQSALALVWTGVSLAASSPAAPSKGVTSKAAPSEALPLDAVSAALETGAGNSPQQASNRFQNVPQLAPLPLWSASRRIPVPLQSAMSDGKAALIAKVEAKFASGEQNFKAGHL